MNKIVRKDGKIYDVWSNDGSFKHTTWTLIGTYEEEDDKPIEQVEKPSKKRKNKKSLEE